MLENPDAGDDLGCGCRRPALQTLLDRLHEGGNAARRQVVRADQRAGPAQQLAQLAVLVVPANPLNLTGVPEQQKAN